MPAWSDCWFRCHAMPVHSFPPNMIGPAQAIAESWLLDNSMRCILTEWVSTDEADEVMIGLLWNGFRLRGSRDRRVTPIPILVQILYTPPYPANIAELRERMQEDFLLAVREWTRGHQKYGSNYELDS